MNKIRAGLIRLIMKMYTPPIYMHFWDWTICYLVTFISARGKLFADKGKEFDKVSNFVSRVFFREQGARCGGICHCDGRTGYYSRKKFACPISKKMESSWVKVGIPHTPDADCASRHL